jgi:hypothetical protein
MDTKKMEQQRPFSSSSTLSFRKTLVPILFVWLSNSNNINSGTSIGNPSSSSWGVTIASAFGLSTMPSKTTRTTTHIGKNRPFLRQSFALFFGDENNVNNESSSTTTSISTSSSIVPSFIESPVLQELYSDMIQWSDRYGHPNIPLKNPGGKLCLTVRRMHIQNKLLPTEVEWLSSIGFIFHSLEEVYKYAAFDEMLSRLVAYELSHPDSDFQVPKKCPEDPELGAWVTGLRRLGPDGVNPHHERQLNDIGFKWISSKQCGSKFMLKYRELVEQVEVDGLDAVLDHPETVPWITAQQEALKRGKLSQTRVHYMGLLFGDMWTTIGTPLSS